MINIIHNDKLFNPFRFKRLIALIPLGPIFEDIDIFLVINDSL
jgi:hypothetical protein